LSGILLSTASDNSVARITAVSNGNNSVGLSLRSLSSGSAVEGIRIVSGGNVGIGTDSPTNKLDVVGGTGTQSLAIFRTGDATAANNAGGGFVGISSATAGSRSTYMWLDADGANLTGTDYFYVEKIGNSGAVQLIQASNAAMTFQTNSVERMRIDSFGNLYVGKTSNTLAVGGFAVIPSDGNSITKTVTSSFSGALVINRAAAVGDGILIEFLESGTLEGNISVSGSTVSYNGGHLSRWSQLPDGSKDDAILKGTVMSNLDDMCVWEKDGVVAANEQLNKMQVSSVEGDTNVAGVFVNWTVDTNYGVDDMNVAMTGDMIIRIADGVVVQKGDLLMSAGDGTAKPQGDDIVRSKTIAKVTSNYVTCTYADGSYCVPCVLMAC
jgi:hypothetical protein